MSKMITVVTNKVAVPAAFFNVARLMILLILPAAGCVSTPSTEYFTLDMRSSGPVEVLPVKLDIQRFRPAEALTRDGILIQASPTRVEYYATAEWAADLAELVPRKLATELDNAPQDAPTLEVTGTILDFGQVDKDGDAEARARLTLEFREPGSSRYDTPLFKKTYHAQVPASPPDPAGVVKALSRALERIALEIAHDVRQHFPR